MPDGYEDEARDALLAKAVQAWEDDPALDARVLGPQERGDGSEDSVSCYLSAYYQRVATEDLAPPSRLAATAQAHARLGQSRPQGRALVQVREPGDAQLHPVSRAGLVVDIVTDDMPYLVDSVTTELNRHEAEIQVLVHPLLRVGRDVTGALRGILGVCGDDAPEVGELTESWIHVELGPPRDKVTADELAAQLRHVLDDVRVAVEDEPRMAEAARSLAGDLGGPSGAQDGTDQAQNETAEFGDLLRWLTEGHFTFLGYREYDLVQAENGMGLRPVTGTGLGILRHAQPGRDTVRKISSQVARRAQDPDERLVLAKANSRSTVYRANYLDYVSVKKLGPDGRVTGEYRFLGLYTHAAHTAPIAGVPVLRRKLAQVLAAAGLSRDSYDGTDLVEILEDYPREELFEISAAQLTPIALGVLRLSERKQTRLFLRRDRYGRYMSCLVYLPRDRYTTKVRLRAQGILREALHGVSVDYSATIGDSALARLYVVVRGEPGRPVPQVDAAALERKLAEAVRSWDEDLAAEAVRVLGEGRASQVLELGARVPETYKADVSAADAVDDLTTMLALRDSDSEFAVRLVEHPERWTLVVYRCGSPITLSDVLPQLQHMGLEVVDEHPYRFTGSSAAGSFWIYEFGLRPPAAGTAGGVRQLFEDALTALWYGQTEDDGFNTLVLAAGLTWREVTLLRACARYLRQGGMRFSEDYVQRVLRSHGAITRLLIRLFESRFDPARQNGASERCEAITEEIRGQLDEVTSLDADRILRSYLALIEATLRTSYYKQEGQSPGPGVDGPRALVLKFDPRTVPGLVEPRPTFEIFVYSPRLEAVHLRFGRVARGGLRWSDRFEDFRTEVLGLVKAQEVKNAVIVPSGRQGRLRVQAPARPGRPRGVPGRGAGLLPDVHRGHARRDRQHRGRPGGAAGRRGPPGRRRPVPGGGGGQGHRDVLRHGQRGGGQVRLLARRRVRLGRVRGLRPQEDGHHRARRLGVGQVALRRARAEPSRPTSSPRSASATCPATCSATACCCREHIQLIAAFDHRHVFLDPAPESAASFAERQRLFALPRSSWADYDQALISPGGGVWPRTVKSVPVSPQVRSALGIDATVSALSPDELISAILAAPVDLLWNGGIGTYVKATTESTRRRRATGPTTRSGSTPAELRAGSSARAATSASPRRPDRVLARRRPDEHRLHRQLGRGRHLRPRGQHQDLAGRRDPGRSHPRLRPARSARGHDRRDRRPGAAAQLRAEHGAGRGQVPGPLPAARARAVPAQADQGQAAQPGAGHGAGRAGDRGAAVLGRRPDQPRDRPADGPHQDRGGRGRALLEPARRPVPAPGARRLLPRSAAGQVRGPDDDAPAPSRDHHHLGGQRDGRHLGQHVPVPADRGDRRLGAGPHPGLAGRPRGVRHVGLLAPGRGA